ncbi:MAG: hypothetical protein DSO01_00495 [Archaeoglobi archaeon]|nr:MAG: hypothetical protein DSN99_06140 [Archaeoglobi archaeon]TDA28520.1 MAG: hypothetical protein DSO01_00495 [Archaeoglobi archaeon]
MEELIIEKEVEFEEAERIARKMANEKGSAIFLAYHDPKTGLKYPNVDCCGERTWELYAKTRGGNFRVKIGVIEFIFRID